MNIPAGHWTYVEDLTRSDNLEGYDEADGPDNEKSETLSLPKGDCHDEVDGNNEKPETLSLTHDELRRFRQANFSDQVDQVDELAITRNDDVPDLDITENTDVKTVDVTSATVLTPSRLTLYYAKDTPTSLTHHLPLSLVTVPLEYSVPVGRLRIPQPHVFLNSETMSRFYGRIRMDKSQIFWLKNVSKNKTIQIQFSKGKRKHSQFLKFDEEIEIKTNYVVTFHTLAFKVDINRGDSDSVYFEIVVEKEQDCPTPASPPSHQIIYNGGHIDRLYMSGESTENNTGGEVHNTGLYRYGMAVHGGASCSPGLPLPSYRTPLGAVSYGSPPVALPNNAPQCLAPAMTNESYIPGYNYMQPQPHIHRSQSRSVYGPSQPHILQSQSRSVYGPSLYPLMTGPYSTNSPPNYRPMAIGPDPQHDYSRSPYPPWSGEGFSQPPPPYYPSPSSTGLNQVNPVDTSRSVLVSSALEEKRPDKFHLQTSELLTGSSKPDMRTKTQSDYDAQSEDPVVDQGQSAQNSDDFQNVSRPIQTPENRNPTGSG